MPYKSLPDQSLINPTADRYAEEALASSRTAAQDSKLVYDLSYGPDPAQAIDLYLPEGAHGDLPVFVFFHGGNFTHGFKEWCGFMAPTFTAFPAIFVSASYRLAPGVSYRDLMRDCFAAVKTARDVAAKYGGDPEKLYVGGHSAGGQIAILLAQRDDWREEAGLPAGAIKAIFPMSANFARRLTDLEADTALHIAPEVPDSPIELATRPLDIPVIIAWGDREKPYVLEEGPLLAEALRKVGTPHVEEIVLPDADHFEAHTRMADPDHPLTSRIRDIIAEG